VEQDVGRCFVAREDGGLDRGAVGHGFVGVDALGRFFAIEVVLEELLNFGDSSGTANENNLNCRENCQRDS
jgi:hypothetical protein